MKKVILASKSARRKELMGKLGIEFVVEASTINEDFSPDGNPEDIVTKLAEAKAIDVGEKHAGEDILAIGADTLVECEGEIIGKPSGKKEAAEILKKLSGNMHTVYTGFTIFNPKTNHKITDVEATKVFFRKLSEEEIADYVASGEPFGKAGGYAVQEKAALFVKRIEGDFYNIVGLPLCSLAAKLKEL